MPIEVKVKYHDPLMLPLMYSKKGNWIDLCVVDVLNLPSVRQCVNEVGEIIGWKIFKGDTIFVSLGVSMELPKEYEAIIAPRSSLFKNHGLILTNSIGVIDTLFCGDEDIWKATLYCLKEETLLKKYERILQFRLLRVQPAVVFDEVKVLGNPNRGGFGSTGRLGWMGGEDDV